MIDDILPVRSHNKISDLGIISIWLTIMFISVILPIENIYVRTILAIPIILFIPGYILMAVFFPKKYDLYSAERIALSFGLSIVIILILGILLNFTLGITLIPIFIILYLYNIMMMTIVIYVREKIPEDIRFSVQLGNIYDIFNNVKPKGRLDFILTAVLIFMIILTVGTINYTITIPKTGESFTEFYILNSSGNDFNISLDPVTLLVGISNHEYSRVNYTLQVVIDKNIIYSEELALDNNKNWKKNMTFTPDKKDVDMKLEFLLFKENNFTVPYRSLHLWVNATRERI